MSTNINEDIARTHYDAFNSRKFERGAALVAADAEFSVVPTGASYHGPAGYKQFLSVWCDAFPTGQVEIKHMLAGAGGVVTEFQGRGTFDGTLAGPMGPIPANGRQLDLAFIEVIEVEAGQIKRLRLYYDMATLLGQLGLLPAPAAEAATR